MPGALNPFEHLRPKFSKQDMVGWVVDNNDPKKLQRCKIRIPQLHRNVPDDMLPWCIVDASQTRANAGGGAGSVNVPVKGAKLYVRFEDNDPHNPRYSGSPVTSDVAGDNELLNENYPHTRGTIDDGGNRNAVNTENETQDFTHKSGTTIHIAADGSISMTLASDHNIGINGDANIDVSGKVNLYSSTEIHMKAPVMNFDQGEADPASANARQRPSIGSQTGNTGY